QNNEMGRHCDAADVVCRVNGGQEAGQLTRANSSFFPPPWGGHGLAFDLAPGQVVPVPVRGKGLHGPWAWGGPNWTPEAPANSTSAMAPSATAHGAGHGLAVESGDGTVVSVAFTGEALSDTWTWDGSNWTQKSPQNSPPARYGSAIAYDSAHGQVVLFGGEFG